VPLYEYQCKPNGHRFEIRHGINDEPVRACPECGAEVRRVIHPVGVVFKGSGFYVTDSRRPQPASTSSDSTEKKSESKPAESSKPAGADKAASG
jgi:putative FmdB family regulatory protein